MHRACVSRSVLILTMFAAGIAAAQMPAPKPTPEVSKLDYFVGSWVLDADMKPGPMGPGGKVTLTQNAHWMEGKFFLLMDLTFKGVSGEGMGLAVYGYDPFRKVYTYNQFNSMGESEQFTGTLDGDTWTWNNEMDIGGKKIQTRYTTKAQSPTVYAFQYEMSLDGKDWKLVLDGKATKK